MIDIFMWVITAIALYGFFLNMKLDKWGYLWWGISNIGFTANDIYIHQYAQAGLFAFYTVFCVYGFIQWNKRDEDKKSKPHKVVVTLNKTVDKDFRKGDMCYWIYGGGKGILKKLDSGKSWHIPSGTYVDKEEIGIVKQKGGNHGRNKVK